MFDADSLPDGLKRNLVQDAGRCGKITGAAGGVAILPGCPILSI